MQKKTKGITIKQFPKRLGDVHFIGGLEEEGKGIRGGLGGGI